MHSHSWFFILSTTIKSWDGRRMLLREPCLEALEIFGGVENRKHALNTNVNLWWLKHFESNTSKNQETGAESIVPLLFQVWGRVGVPLCNSFARLKANSWVRHGWDPVHVGIKNVLILDILKISGFSLGSSNSSNMDQVSKKDQKLGDDSGMQMMPAVDLP